MKIIIEALIEMSKAASVVIMAVMLVRLFLRRSPKIYSYLLWAIVGFRLCIPVTFESRLSIFNLFARADKSVTAAVTSPEVKNPTTQVDPYMLIGCIWFSGALILTIYGIFTYYRLQHKLKISFPMGDGVYGVENLSSPFVTGFMSPKIYIPLGLDSDTERYVLMHERTHLRRGDHIIKLFAFLLLCIHWFNPFCWLAFVLMSRDMEMSCDERVLKAGVISSDYSTVLLGFATNKHFPAPGPICFGEVSVKRRIRNILNWKKPGLWMTLLSCIVCIAVFVSCAGGAVEKRTPAQTKPKDMQGSSIHTSDTDKTDTDTLDTVAADTSTSADTALPDTEAAETTPETQPVPETQPEPESVYVPDTAPPVAAVPQTQPPVTETEAPVRQRIENEEDRPDIETEFEAVRAVLVHP